MAYSLTLTICDCHFIAKVLFTPNESANKNQTKQARSKNKRKCSLSHLSYIWLLFSPTKKLHFHLHTDVLTSNSSFMKLFLVSLLSSSVSASLPLATPSSTEKLLYTRCVVYIEWLERPKRIVTVPFIFALCKCTLTLAKISDLLFSKKKMSRKIWSERRQTSGCIHLAGVVINNFNSHIYIARSPVYSICSTIVLLDTREKD